MEKRKRLIVLGLIGLVLGVYFGATSGSSSLLIRFLVGLGMGLISFWLASGFLK